LAHGQNQFSFTILIAFLGLKVNNLMFVFSVLEQRSEISEVSSRILERTSSERRAKLVRLAISDS